MPSTCPGCGADAEFSPRSVRAVHGTCTACGGTFTVVQPEEGPDGPGAGTGSGEGAEGGSPELSGAAHQSRPASPPGPPCGECGAPLALRTWTADFAKASCSGCGATVEYRTGPVGREPRGRPRGDFRGGERDRGFPAPRAKPCRECGGPLNFSTDASGVVTGECASCGNRFTLPPRAGSGGRPPTGRPGRFSRGYAPRFPRSSDRSGDRDDRRDRRGPPRRPFRRRERPDDDGDEEDRGRRRRRSRDE